MLNAEPIIGQEARREIRPKSTMSLIGVVLAGLLAPDSLAATVEL